MSKYNEETVGFMDGCGELFIGKNDNEIVSMMSKIEYSDGKTSPFDWKSSVQMRAKYLGIEINFTNSYNFLNELERVGLGTRVNPSFRPKNVHKITDFVKKNL